MVGESDARRLAQVEQGLSDTVEGFCDSVDWGSRLVYVNIGGALQAMPWSGPAPWEGDRVRVTYGGRKPYCEAVWGAPLGTVQSTGGGYANVIGDDELPYTYPYLVAVVAGNRVRLDHAGRAVTGIYLDEPAGSTYVRPPAPPASSGGTATFRPTDSGNYRYGVYDGPYVEISTTRSGFYWYGEQIAQTIPDTATITKAVLRLTERWDNVPGTPSLLGTHTQPSRGGPPALSGSFPVTGGGEVNLIEAGYADRLKTGAAYGVGFAQNTGWRQFDTAAGSGSIYMEWQG